MGSSTSTRWAGYDRKLRVEECIALTADKFRGFEAGMELTVTWSTGDQIRVVRLEKSLMLNYRITATKTWIRETVAFSQPNQRRWYFHCVQCKRRAGKLYKRPGHAYFRCRLCYDLTYRSVQKRRKYQGLSRFMASKSGVSASRWERFFNSNWGYT